MALLNNSEKLLRSLLAVVVLLPILQTSSWDNSWDKWWAYGGISGEFSRLFLENPIWDEASS